MTGLPKITEGILGGEDIPKMNARLFIDVAGRYFPAAVKDGEIDLAALREELGDFPEVGAERYEFTWAGKQAAKKEAVTDLFGRTLRFKPEYSVNADTTENIYIEGDNLEALKLLRRNYRGAVKMIYIDPPYNTGSDFIYRDNFTMSKEELGELSGEIVAGERMQRNTKDNSQFHTKWLNMIYPRIKTARELLSDDGAIFIHIDEHEVSSMQFLCNEIFGENNQLGTIIWDKRNPKGAVAGVAYQHESILLYCKDINVFSASPFSKRKEHAAEMTEKVSSLIKKHGGVNAAVRAGYQKWLRSKKNIFAGGESAYCLIDDSGNIYQSVSMAAPDKPETRSHRALTHPVTGKPCPVPAKGWRFTDATMDELLSKNRIEFGSDESTQPRQKYFLKDNLEESVASLLYFGGSDDAAALPFDNPKPVAVAARLISTLCKGNGDIILDFFSGSATAAHAVMQLNAEDGGSRRFIMVQLPEKCDEKSGAGKAGYKNICEIGRERIRRAAEKIAAEYPGARFDGGFKAFEIADTNIRWLKTRDGELTQLDLVGKDPDRIDFTDGYTDTDVVYEIMLRQYGVPLSGRVERLESVSGRTYIFGRVVVCLEPEITDGLIGRLAAVEPVPDKFVLRDSAFGDDIQFKETSYRRLAALISNRREPGEKENGHKNYMVEFI